jgi:Reverse transcriptase (RNA-dependent DNA polymerase)
VLVYVDDIIIIGNNLVEINYVKKDLKQKFKIKDLNKLKYILGIEIAHSQKKFLYLKENIFLICLKKSVNLDANRLKHQ